MIDTQGTFTQIATAGANVPSYTDSGLNQSTGHSYTATVAHVGVRFIGPTKGLDKSSPYEFREAFPARMSKICEDRSQGYRSCRLRPHVLRFPHGSVSERFEPLTIACEAHYHADK